MVVALRVHERGAVAGARGAVRVKERSSIVAAAGVVVVNELRDDSIRSEPSTEPLRVLRTMLWGIGPL